MNIKKTILTFLILLVFGTTNAQSDATWVETIAFIKKYAFDNLEYEDTYFDDIYVYNLSYPAGLRPYCTVDKNFLIIKYKVNAMETSYNNKKTFCRLKADLVITVPFSELYSVSNSGYNAIKLDLNSDKINTKASGEYYKCMDNNFAYEKGGSTINSSKWSKSIKLTIEHEEMRERMFSAFSHLAKLATEKREADRKASGDKF